MESVIGVGWRLLTALSDLGSLIRKKTDTAIRASTGANESARGIGLHRGARYLGRRP